MYECVCVYACVCACVSLRVCVCVCKGVKRGTSVADSPSMLFLSGEHQILADGGTLGHSPRLAVSRSNLQCHIKSRN